MTHIGLFEGIGGFSYAAKVMGWETIAWCEINPFGQQVLKHHFPTANPHHDIKQTDFTIYRGQCDILTGGFPCQPYSTAGKRLGTEDDRHLWPQMLRSVREIQPRYVVGENVRGLTNWNGGLVFDQVQADLEAEGYEVLPFLLPACAVNAPHRRDRIWFVAYAQGRNDRGNKREISGEDGRQELNDLPAFEKPSSGFCCEGLASYTGLQRPPECEQQATGLIQCDQKNNVTDAAAWRLQRSQPINYEISRKAQSKWSEQASSVTGSGADETFTNTSDTNEQRNRVCEKLGPMPAGGCDSKNHGFRDFPTQSPLCSRDDGLSTELSGITFSKHRNESIKAYGNAIVPQVALQIFKAIEKMEWLK